MDQASELMFWPAHPQTSPPDQSGVRNLNTTMRPLMEHAFGVDWEIADQLKSQHDLVGIALKSTPGPDYETYMTSRQVREHMHDQGFDAVSIYGLVRHARTYSSFCGPIADTYWARPDDESAVGADNRLFFGSFGPLPPIMPVPIDTDPRPEPRRFQFPVC